VVNPAEPEEAPCCLVADVEVSREELADLYGGATAGLAVQAAGWDGPGRVGKLPLAPDDEDMAEAVARLGVVRWLQEWSPLPLDWRLLRLEELTLVTSLTGHLADEPDRLPELAELCRYFHDHLDEENFAPLTGLLGDALEQVANRSPLSGDSGDWARRLLATWPAGEETAPPGWLDAELIDRFRPEFALAAGAEGWETLVESVTVDWEQVPRGWVGTDENNARWVLDLDVDGVVHCVVVVDGPQEVRWFGGVPWGREPGEDDRLGFDLFSGDAPEPVLSGQLGYDPRTCGWAGSVSFSYPGQSSVVPSLLVAQTMPLSLRWMMQFSSGFLSAFGSALSSKPAASFLVSEMSKYSFCTNESLLKSLNVLFCV